MKKNDFILQENEPYYIVKLRRLIAKMTAAEKLVFKKYIRNYSESNNQDAAYIQLFDCVNDAWMETERQFRAGKVTLPKGAPEAEAGSWSQEQVFYEKFRARFRLRAVAKPEELGSKANYVYYKIIESLRSHNPDDSLRRELLAMMLDINLLYRKGLFEDCMSLLEQAKAIARKMGLIAFELDLLRTQRRLLLLSDFKAESLDVIRKISQTEELLLQQLSAIAELNDLQFELVISDRLQLPVDRDETLKAKINRNLTNLTTEELPETSFVELEILQAGCISAMINLSDKSPFLEFIRPRRTKPGALHYHRKVVSLFDENPHLIAEDPIRYRINVVNYLGNALAMGQPVNLASYDAVLNEIDPSEPEFLSTVVLIRLMWFIRNKEFAKAQEYLQAHKVYDLLNKPDSLLSVSRRQTICYNAGIALFVRESYKEAEKWFDMIQSENLSGGNVRVIIASIVFGLICGFEIGRTKTHKFKDALLQPLQRRIGKDALAAPGLELTLVEGLLEILKTNNDRAPLQQLCAALLPDLSVKLETRPDMGHFALLLGWLDSKAQGKPLRVAMEAYL